MVATEPATTPMRDHDERQLIACKTAVPCPLDDFVSDGCLLLRRVAWIPDGPGKRSAFGVGCYVEKPNAGGLGRDGGDAQRHAEKDRQ
jgi:hypothetical protein